ncbi:MAG: AAC(3) family N-acetyltransferase, partial [Erysipelotrichaceae bacterium]|nr:AAC(3) family N-acetyltransferase [Erysipelotrichaceae bacterium]
LEAVGYEGTIVMPLQSSNNTEPSYWEHPPVDRHLWETIRKHMPAFDSHDTDTQQMGAVVDNFRRRRGTYVSNHPNAAFVAYGKYAKLICSKHELNYSLSETSPLGQMVRLKANVLLLGVGYDHCTGMHLGEYQSQVRPIVLQGGKIETDSISQWVKYLDIDLNSDEFIMPGRMMEEKGLVKRKKIGQADCRLFSLRQAVDFTSMYLKKKYAEQ